VEGIVNNDADAGFAHDDFPGLRANWKVSPRGIIWRPLPHKGRGRLGPCPESRRVLHQAVANLRRRDLARKAVEMGNYPYPNFVTYASKSNDEIYAVTKAMIEGYDSFKDGAPERSGLSVKRQTMQWVCPFTGLRESPQGSRQLE